MGGERPAVRTGDVNGNVVGEMSGGAITGYYGATPPDRRPDPAPARPAAGAPDADYHLAFTFAGEQREYVERTKEECEVLGLEVMYDFDRVVDWWGRNFIAEQRQVYAGRTLFVVAFISEEYLRKPVPRDEFTAAMWTDVQRGGGYILPVIMDDVRVPLDMLHPSVAYINVRRERPAPADLAVLLNRKLLSTLLIQPREPKRITEIVREAMAKPAVAEPPSDPVDAVVTHLRTRIEAARDDIRRLGCELLLASGDGLRFDVVRAGAKVYGLEVRRDRHAPDVLVVRVHRHTEFGGELRDNAELVHDPYDATPRLRLRKRGLLPGMTGDPVELTKEDLFERVWQDIRARLDNR